MSVWATFAFASAFALFAKIGGASDGIQAACGLVALAACLVISEVLP